jgi:hypothetical protein
MHEIFSQIVASSALCHVSDKSNQLARGTNHLRPKKSIQNTPITFDFAASETNITQQAEKQARKRQKAHLSVTRGEYAEHTPQNCRRLFHFRPITFDASQRLKALQFCSIDFNCERVSSDKIVSDFYWG